MIRTPPPAHAFTLSLTAQPSDIDELGHVNNAVWVQWIQLAATSHWAARATVHERSNYVWVVVRHEIDYLRPLTAGQTVTAHTWVGETARGARFDRYVHFKKADGVAYVTACTSWAFINRASGRPQRVPAELVARFHQNMM